MNAPSDPRSVAVCQRFALWTGWAATAAGLLVLTGRWLEAPVLQGALGGTKSQHPLSAVALVIAGVALAAQARSASGRARRVVGITGASLLALIAVVVLGGRLLGGSPTLDQLLFRAAVAGDRMALATALGLLFTGGALALLDASQRGWRLAGQVLGLAVAAIGLVAVVGQLYGVVFLPDGPDATSMSLVSAAAFTLLGLGLLGARPQHGLMKLVVADNLGGVTLRRLLPAAVFIPFALGGLRMLLEHGDWLDHRFGLALFALVNTAVLTALIIWTAAMLQSVDVRNKQIEQALRASERRARTIIDTARDAFIAMTAEGEIAEWNPQAEAIFGWTREEAVGRQLSETVIPPRYRQAHEEGRWRFLATGEGPVLNQRIEIAAWHRDGREFPVELTVTPIRLGATWLFAAFVHDISQRKQTEAELHRAKETAEEASRAKSEFLANMSHEIRTPLNGVIGMTELALDTELTPEQREYLNLAKTSAEQLLAVINDILDFSKIEAGKLEMERIDFDLRELVDNTARTLALRAHRKGLELACHVLADVPQWLVGDPGRLRQVLVNLVGNAIKFTEAGEVVIRVAVASRTDDEVELHVSVRDTGIGIPHQRQPALFQAFTQVDASTTRKYGGTGLGLAIAQSLVKMMRGRIWLESEPGVGSTFHFSTRLGISRQSPPPPSDGGRPLENLSVLVVDDNATNRLILTEMLSHWGMQPTAVDSGAGALAALEEALAAGRRFDLVLLDKQMPHLDGFAVAARIHQHPGLAGATVMMLSSSSRSGDLARCRELGVAACLTKPIKQSDLLDAIMTAVGALPDEADRLRAQARAPLGRCRRSLRLLLAEDNPVNQTLAVRLLQKRGHVVVVCNNGREALEALARDTFDVVLMDVQMPHLDGLEATAAIRRQERQTGGHLPIVAMTAHAMQGDRAQCLEAGMDGYVAKPLQPAELFAAVEQFAGGGEPAPEAPDARHDANVFDEPAAMKHVDGDRQLLAELLEIFREQSPQWLGDVRSAVVRRDAASLRRAAHRLKGAAGNLGFVEVLAAARDLESLSAAADWEQVESRLAQLEQAMRRLAETHPYDKVEATRVV